MSNPLHDPFLPLSDFYGEWSKTVTKTCLPLLQESLSSAALANGLAVANGETVLGHLEKYYENLNLNAIAELRTIPHLLFPSWPNSLEFQTLLLGDIHPYLLTNLVRSFIKRANKDSGETSLETDAWKDSPDRLIKIIGWIEAEIEVTIIDLLERMKKAQSSFTVGFSDEWVKKEQQKKTVETAAFGAMDMAAKEEIEELGNIFILANDLRKKVIRDIVNATSNPHQAALFLEGLCQYFVGFAYQTCISASPLLIQHPTDHAQGLDPPPFPNRFLPHPVPSNDRTLWLGEVPNGMTENFLFSVFDQQSDGGIVSVKIPNGMGCAFIEFESWAAADFCLKQYGNQEIPGSGGRLFNLRWSNRRRTYTIYLRGLAAEVTAEKLMKTFRVYYRSVINAFATKHHTTRLCTGSGWVSFSDVNDQLRARREMEGFQLHRSPMRIII